MSTNSHLPYQFRDSYVLDSDMGILELIERGYKFDLVLTDPPYNIGKDFGNNSDKLDVDEFLAITRKRLSNLAQLLNENGSIVWFGIHNYIGLVQTIMYDLNLHYRRMLIWHYSNGFSRNQKTPATTYEPILWFSKSKSKWTYNADDLRVPYKTERVKNPVYYKGTNGERKAWVPNPKGALRGDVWEIPTLAGKHFESERTEHPTQKPESLITDLLQAFVPKNADGMYSGTVFDPFHGSGTLGVCSEKLNSQGHQIDWIGFEIEEKWNEIAKLRLGEVQRAEQQRNMMI